jgi:hypothetical protein
MPGVTVTLTNANVAYNLYDLIIAITGHATERRTCRHLSLMAESPGGGNSIWWGGSDVSATNHGGQLDVLGFFILMGKTWISEQDNIALSDRWLITDAPGSKVNVDWWYE